MYYYYYYYYTLFVIRHAAQIANCKSFTKPTLHVIIQHALFTMEHALHTIQTTLHDANCTSYDIGHNMPYNLQHKSCTAYLTHMMHHASYVAHHTHMIHHTDSTNLCLYTLIHTPKPPERSLHSIM